MMIETTSDKAVKAKMAKGEMTILSRATSLKIDEAVSNSFKKHKIKDKNLHGMPAK